MKIVRSKRPDHEVVVPVKRGYRVRFHNGQAMVPDEVAGVMLAMGGGFYEVGVQSAEDALVEAHLLIVRDMGLGDVLLTTPLIRTLATTYRAQVDVLTLDRYRCLFDGNPYVQKVLALESDDGKRDRWDLVLDLRHIVENAENAGVHRHRVDAFCEFADITLPPGECPGERQLDYFVSEEEKASLLVQSILEASETYPEQKDQLAYVLRSSTSNRNWSERTHRKVIQALIAAGYGVILLDHERHPQFDDLHEYSKKEAPSEGSWGTFWNATGDLSLREVFAVMWACDACLTPDTGLFHAAGALNLPTFAYFGAFPAAERYTHPRLAVLNERQNCALLPCRKYMCLNRDDAEQPRCLDIDPRRVVTAMDALLARKRGVADGESQQDAASMAPPEVDAIGSSPEIDVAEVSSWRLVATG